jgi:hypothetical protein
MVPPNSETICQFYDLLHRQEGLLLGSCTPVPRVVGYGPTNLDTTQFRPAANCWGTKYSAADGVLPHLTREGEGLPP